ncbi:hypothetical protein ACFV3R_18185 [Streptomyces sp. NPDC059740]|uniref:hypothetical protein n=1 Tax=Streptomyces sp. NPDC059740 TaxID=3346926 RepID=UPI003654CFB9
MVSKKMEGNEEQRRAAAHAAARSEELPSERGGTTGASKQRTHLSHHVDVHEERTATRHRGKQRDPQRTAERGSAPEPSGVSYQGRNVADYTPSHERVFRALSDLERERSGAGVYLEEVARRADTGRAETRDLLHDLTAEQRLVTELQGVDNPDLGPRYEVKPRF